MEDKVLIPEQAESKVSSDIQRPFPFTPFALRLASAGLVQSVLHHSPWYSRMRRVKTLAAPPSPPPLTAAPSDRPPTRPLPSPAAARLVGPLRFSHFRLHTV